MRFGLLFLVLWFGIGAIAAGQRGYYATDSSNCSTVGSTVTTIAAGPLNYFGLNPEIECEAPQPSE